MTTTIDLSEFACEAPLTGDVIVVGGGVVKGVSFAGAKWRSLQIGDTLPLSTLALHALRLLRTKRHIAVFEDCDFSGVRTTGFDPGISRFIRCKFSDVRIKPQFVLTHAHFIDCTFSGEWEGNFSAESTVDDPARKVSIIGNDFRGCSGMDFHDGVPLEENQFDIGGRHVVVRRDGPGWGAVVERSRSDQELRIEVGSLISEQHSKNQQNWVLFHRSITSPDLWQFLVREVLEGAEREPFVAPRRSQPDRSRRNSNSTTVKSTLSFLEYRYLVASSDELAMRLIDERSIAVSTIADPEMLCEFARRLADDPSIVFEPSSVIRVVETNEESTVLFEVLPQLVELLSTMTPEAMRRIAKTWFGEGESIPRSFNPWDEDAVLELLRVLADLAKRSIDGHQKLYGCQAPAV